MKIKLILISVHETFCKNAVDDEYHASLHRAYYNIFLVNIARLLISYGTVVIAFTECQWTHTYTISIITIKSIL